VAPDDAPTSSFAPPRPEEPTLAEQSPAMALSPYPFGLRNAAASYAYAYTATHEDTLGHRQRFALNLSTTLTPRMRTRHGPEWISPDSTTLGLCASSWPQATTASATPTPTTKAPMTPLASVFTSGSGCRGRAKRTRGQVAVPCFAQAQAPSHLHAPSCRPHEMRTSLLRDLSAQT